MIVICKTNDAFEDQLTCGYAYPLIATGNASVQICNDGGQLRWYGAARFEFAAAPCEACAGSAEQTA